MSTILAYVRPWSQEQFLDLARQTWPGADVKGVSEHRTIDEVGLQAGFYRAYRQRSFDASWMSLTAGELDNLIICCRFLRNIPRERAERFVTAMAVSVRQVFERHHPQAVLSLTVDHYGMHLLAMACERRGIPFVGIVTSFLNGYFRVTTTGERLALREPTADEIDTALSTLLDREYKPSNLASSSNAIRATSRALWARNLFKPLGLRFMRLAKRDLLNQHYAQSQYFADRYWTLAPQHVKGRIVDEIDWQDIKSSRKVTIFLPLQMSPEATIDYWSVDKSWVAYEEKVLSILDSHPHIAFAVKEHPAVIGYRTPDFYRKVTSRENAIMIAPEVSSNILVERCDGVVVCTGTVGFEAALRGVPVFSDSSPYYARPGDLLPLKELREFSDLDGLTALTEEEQRSRVGYLLEGLLPGKVVYDGTWKTSSADKHRNIINSLRTFYRVEAA